MTPEKFDGYMKEAELMKPLYGRNFEIIRMKLIQRSENGPKEKVFPFIESGGMNIHLVFTSSRELIIVCNKSMYPFYEDMAGVFKDSLREPNEPFGMEFEFREQSPFGYRAVGDIPIENTILQTYTCIRIDEDIPHHQRDDLIFEMYRLATDPSVAIGIF